MRIHKEFPRQIHLYVSDSQWDALHEEALSQRIGVSSLVRGCIDQQLNPELRLKFIINNRDNEITRLHGEVLPHLDEMERQEYGELTVASDPDTDEVQIEWLKTKKEMLAQRATHKVQKAADTSHSEELKIDELLDEFKNRT